MAPASLVAGAVTVLCEQDSAAKCRLTRELTARWRDGNLPVGNTHELPARPARPDRPALLPPADVPRRRINRGTKGRIALLHALAHIELNAIDLAWDIVARFAALDLPRGFHDDWVRVAHEEAMHFELLVARLAEFGAAYGDLPAHDGLWDSAVATRHDLAARLAIVPLVLEARGLDVTPAMIARLRAVDDHASADVLEVIYREEIGHVAIGQRWFEHVCADQGHEPEAHWQNLVETCFRGALKPPYNVDARTAAGMPESWYTGLTADGG